jgi:hypothetical protein
VATGLEHQGMPDPVEFAEKMLAFFAHVGATRLGPPPATSRTGLPQVCASMQKKVFTAIFMNLLKMRIWGFDEWGIWGFAARILQNFESLKGRAKIG